MASFDDEQFERFIWEWVNGYLGKRYSEVQHRGGAGDKGRDIIGWVDDSTRSPRRWDLYQCKRYKDPLTPSDFTVELGKLCYYTFQQAYTIPRCYMIVAPKGVGNKLQDLIDNPEALRSDLISNWSDRCLDKITRRETVKLEGEFEQYVASFDFSIVKTLPPSELIEQHKQTGYHIAVFGSGFRPRPPVSSPPTDVKPSETGYIRQLFDAFSDHLKATIADPDDFQHHPHLCDCFSHARECFYSAESLKEFSRDNLSDDSAFTDLRKQMLQGVRPTLNRLHADGYQKLSDVTEKAVAVQITSNILVTEMEPNDRVGLCHQLANDGTIRWVR